MSEASKAKKAGQKSLRKTLNDQNEKVEISKKPTSREAIRKRIEERKKASRKITEVSKIKRKMASTYRL